MGALALSAAMLLTGGGGAANTVNKTNDICWNAHAILAASTSGNEAAVWEAIGGVAKARPFKWKIVENYEQGVAQKISFRQYDTRFQEGGTAFVAHCGHGGTCNEFAEEVLKSYPSIGSPGVYCGEIPHILANPQSAPF